MKKDVRVLIVQGYGINCETETAWAFKKAGADNVDKVHVNRIIENRSELDRYKIIVFPGGFSFGDHISSGKVLAMKVKTGMSSELARFINEGRLVMGICNGFQALVKMGILPGSEDKVYPKQSVTLKWNDSARYEDRWVSVKANPQNKSPFLNDIDTMRIPVRHGEGKFFSYAKRLREIKRKNQIAFQYIGETGEPTMEYPCNPNGSELSIAAITNSSGNVLGMMPHPEAFISSTHEPRWTEKSGNNMNEEGAGLKLFVNAVKYAADML
ncbi:MAG: phosphoribosylformylglycinamidine synthase I [bacterium]